ncbi:MAG: hypothetical protein ACR2PL_03010, partial [Dehalococcoidia bacterium]
MRQARLEEWSSEALVSLVGDRQRDLAAVKQALAEALARNREREQAVARLGGGSPPKTPATASIPLANGGKRSRRVQPEPGSEQAKGGAKFGQLGSSRRRVARAGVDAVRSCRATAGAHGQQPLPEPGGTVVGRCQVVAVPPVRPVV